MVSTEPDEGVESDDPYEVDESTDVGPLLVASGMGVPGVVPADDCTTSAVTISPVVRLTAMVVYEAGAGATAAEPAAKVGAPPDDTAAQANKTTPTIPAKPKASLFLCSAVASAF
jgi:hypothetical protein